MSNLTIKTADYLDRLLLKYSNDFNIYKPYRMANREFSAYGYFFSHNEKYVLVKEVNMWASDSYEHILFFEAERITEREVQEAYELITRDMECELVRKGAKYPSKDHMQSVLTLVLLSDRELDNKAIKLIEKFKFDRGYQFGMRGYSRGRIIAASMEKEKVIASAQAKDMKKILQNVFEDVKSGKPGFTETCEKQGVTPFVQED